MNDSFSLFAFRVYCLLSSSQQLHSYISPKYGRPSLFECETQLRTSCSGSANNNVRDLFLIQKLMLLLSNLAKHVVDRPSSESMLPDALYILGVLGLTANINHQHVIINGPPTRQLYLVLLALDFLHSL